MPNCAKRDLRRKTLLTIVSFCKMCKGGDLRSKTMFKSSLTIGECPLVSSSDKGGATNV
jgi:hypothetical protein